MRETKQRRMMHITLKINLYSENKDQEVVSIPNLEVIKVINLIKNKFLRTIPVTIQQLNISKMISKIIPSFSLRRNSLIKITSLIMLLN